MTNLLDELKEIFLHVADAVDGGEKVPAHLKEAYEKAMTNRAVQAYYREAVDEVSQSFDKTFEDK